MPQRLEIVDIGRTILSWQFLEHVAVCGDIYDVVSEHSLYTLGNLHYPKGCLLVLSVLD